MSMDAFHRALYAFWSNLSVNGETFPVYLQGTVPNTAAFPFITFDVIKPQALEAVPLSATFWQRRVQGSTNALRNAFLDAAACAIPQAGTRIDFEGGYCILRRSSGTFLALLTDNEDPSVTGGRVGYEVYVYDM